VPNCARPSFTFTAIVPWSQPRKWLSSDLVRFFLRTARLIRWLCGQSWLCSIPSLTCLAKLCTGQVTPELP
jgi:hypothetical protein